MNKDVAKAARWAGASAVLAALLVWVFSTGMAIVVLAAVAAGTAAFLITLITSKRATTELPRKSQLADGTVSIPAGGRRLSAIMLAFFSALGLALLLFEKTKSAFDWVLWPVETIFFALAAFRTWRSRLVLSEDGVKSFSERRTLFVRWIDVDHFEDRGAWRGLGGRMKNGRWQRLLNSPGFGSESSPVVRELEEARLAHADQHRSE